MEPKQHSFQSSTIELCYFEWGDPADQTILLLHATGFHARCWDKLVDALPGKFHVIAVDAPGHGRSGNPESLADWAQTSDTIGELTNALDIDNAIGVGHSMGGFCLTWLAAQMPERFARLVLIDPVMMEPARYDNIFEPSQINPGDHPISRRRADWSSPREMFERLKDHPSYAVWQEDILMDYCSYGLLEQGDGFTLACPPHLEASVYMGSLCRDPYPSVLKIECPVLILRAEPVDMTKPVDFRKSPTWAGLVDKFSAAEEIFRPDITHFMPMQEPEWVADLIAGVNEQG